ncbi:hypothetical protein QBC38DRAFT_500919 [Podospora fimiseda]|uniref:Uncharacterized protein n=1 Tax=Podospora fimiseda TaxID=252190 RepID=A0AAN7BM57_9PEZI|nr:hypothetical protein QBC38DRAFT_500919 [Podospora fimiseda]
MAAAYPLPGTYPGSIPPTPDETPVQQQQKQHFQKPPHQHNHHERNKLHKPQDPRDHTATDSGVGLSGSEPIYTSQNNYHWDGPSEAVSGGTYSRDNNATTAFESARLNNDLPRNPDLPSKGADQDVHKRTAESSVPTAQLAPQSSEEEFPQRTSEGTSKPFTEVSSNRNSASDSLYWGSIPKAAGGGIYNTVTGHGSANDDHAHHHGLPQRGGIYNTVAGHGSKEEVESQRHSFSQSGGEAIPIPTAAGTQSRNNQQVDVTSSVAKGALFAAPLTNISEQEQKSAPRDTDQQLSPRSAVSQAKPEPAQRAFPLAPSHAGLEDDRRRSDSRTRDTALGTAAGLGAGAAAYSIADKHRRDKNQTEPAPVAEEQRHSRRASEDQGYKATGGLFGRKSRDEKRSASVDKHKKQLHSEEKKHKVFGLFQRHKDDEPKKDTSTSEPARKSVDRVERKEEVLAGTTSSPKTRNRLRKGSKSERRSSSTDSDRSGHGKEKLAAAAGVGALGLHHHKKEENLKDAARKPLDTTPAAQQIQQNTETSTAPNRNAQVAAETAAGLVGGYGMARRNHEKSEFNILPVTEEVPTPFEHPREPPMPPQEDMAASGVSAADPIPKANHPNVAFTALPSGAPAGPSSFQPSELNNTRGNIVTQQPGEYNHLPSGTDSGVKVDSLHSSEPTHSGYSKGAAAMGAVGLAAEVKHESHRASESTGSKGDGSDKYMYNHLPSGTATGINHDTSTTVNTAAYKTASESATSRPPNDRTDSGPYNKLPSGTPSGVKIKPKEHRPRQTSEPGVQSNLAVNAMPPRRSVDVPSSRKDLPLPPSSSSPTNANTQIHHTILHAPETGKATNPPPASHQAAEFTPFPNPGMAQNMSPEVMPESYRQSVAPAHTDRTEKDVSSRESTNDVVPSAAAWQQQQHSKQSAPAFIPAAPIAPSPSIQTQNNTLYQSKDRSSVDPALAAATASWGVTGGLPTSNVLDKVMHRCEHCGKENDVTSLVKKEQEKLRGGSMMPSGNHGLWSRSK